MPSFKRNPSGPDTAPGAPVPSSRQIETTAPLQGGGDLTEDRTLSIDTSQFHSSLTIRPGHNIEVSPTTFTTSGNIGLSDNLVVQSLYLHGAATGANRVLVSGELSAGTGAPAGSTGQIQFNTGNSFDAESALRWDAARNILTASGSVYAASGFVGGSLQTGKLQDAGGYQYFLGSG